MCTYLVILSKGPEHLQILEFNRILEPIQQTLGNGCSFQ